MWKNRGNRVRTRGEDKKRSGIPHPELIFLLLVGNDNCGRVEWRFKRQDQEVIISSDVGDMSLVLKW